MTFGARLVIVLMCTTVGAALLAGCGAPAPVGPLPFTSASFDEAGAQATAQHKLLLVDAMASWCPPCRTMERDAWPEAKVSAWIGAHAIAVQVDVDEQEAVARRLDIRAMPTLILFRDGQELARSVGGMDANQLLSWLETSGGAAAPTTPAPPR